MVKIFDVFYEHVTHQFPVFANGVSEIRSISRSGIDIVNRCNPIGFVAVDFKGTESRMGIKIAALTCQSGELGTGNFSEHHPVIEGIDFENIFNSDGSGLMIPARRRVDERDINAVFFVHGFRGFPSDSSFR